MLPAKVCKFSKYSPLTGHVGHSSQSPPSKQHCSEREKNKNGTIGDFTSIIYGVSQKSSVAVKSEALQNDKMSTIIFEHSTSFRDELYHCNSLLFAKSYQKNKTHIDCST